MEIVAMDMKLRGMYIARQLSFSGVSFRIDEVELPEELRSVYNKSVDLWVELMHKFEEAAQLVEADKRVRKTMWGQFWSAHQRFFKYLCIASKVPHVVEVANEVQCQAGAGKKKRSGDDSEYIKLYVEGSEVSFRVKKTMPLEKLKKKYSERIGVRAHTLMFCFEGHRIHDDDTAENLELEEGDTIEVIEMENMRLTIG